MSVFNAFDYLYLNPELSAYMNVTSVEQAQTYYNANTSKYLATSLSVLPSNFNSEVFLTSARDLANISSLSQGIKLAMANQGLTAQQISKKQKYVANVYQSVQYLGANAFGFTGSNTISSNNLISGDAIKVIDDKSTEMYFTVASSTSNSFMINTNNTILYQSSNYLFYGINVTDYDRIAQVNYARIIGGYSNVNSNGVAVSAVSSSNTNFVANAANSNFNPQLYRMLYPDSRALSDVQTYLDWVNKRKNEVYRILNVDDVAFGNGNKYVNFNYLNISSNIVFRGSFINGITEYINPASCNIPGDSNKIATENAIKYYTDFRMSNLQNLGSFTNMVINDSILVKSTGTFSNNANIFGSLYVNSNSSFSNDVNIVGNTFIKSNLDVTASSTFRNSMLLSGGNANATFCNCVLVNGSMSVTGNIYNARIGLGYMGSFLTSNNGSNIIQAQNYNDNSDRRIKKDIDPVSPEDCLAKICKMNIASFSYNYGHPETDAQRTTGLIAQELEDQGLGEYVYYTPGYLPDIMKNGVIDGDHLCFVNNTDNDIEAGKDIKLITEDDEEVFLRVIRKLERGVFEVAPPLLTEKRRCLIYGYRTSSLRNVDYKQLFVLALGAIKCLAATKARA